MNREAIVRHLRLDGGVTILSKDLLCGRNRCNEYKWVCVNDQQLVYVTAYSNKRYKAIHNGKSKNNEKIFLELSDVAHIC